MASYLNPQPSNAIVDDLTAIRELANYNAQNDPSLGTGFPTGAKRLVNVGTSSAPNWQWQRYNGSAWVAIGATASEKLMHNVDMLDGYHASTSAVKNTIPVYNASAQLVGSITGNAATATKLQNARNIQLGGIISSTAQSFNGTAAITIPVNSVTINNAADDAVVGVLTTAHGGTGRNDGVSADVEVNSLSGKVKASEYGQIGTAKKLTATTDLNSLLVDGWYASSGKFVGSLEHHFPENNNGVWSLHVSANGNHVHQVLSNGARHWSRFSTTGGASWDSWYLGNTYYTSQFAIYVSKSGDDANTGLDSAYPVKTLTRAIRLAKDMVSPSLNAIVKFCIGAGDWGNLTIYSAPFNVVLSAYDGYDGTAYSESFPVFGTISVENSNVTIGNCIITKANSLFNGNLRLVNYNKIGSIEAFEFSLVVLTNSAILEVGTTNPGYLFRSTWGGYFLFNPKSVTFTESVSYSTGVFRIDSDSSILFESSNPWKVADGVTVTGRKYVAHAPAQISNKSFAENTPASQEGTASAGVAFGGVPNNAVLITGDQTIAGRKTFSDTIVTTSSFNNTQKAFTRATLPTSSVYWHLNCADVNNNVIARLQNYINSDGSSGFTLRHAPYDLSKDTLILGIGFDKDGTPWSTAPTTANMTTSNQIVTADYLNTTGILSPSRLEHINLANIEAYPEYENDFNKLTTPGYYHVRWATETLNAPVSSTYTDGILEVKWVGSASNISSYRRCVQTLRITGPAANYGRIFTRSMSSSSGYPWWEWHETITDNSPLFTKQLEVTLGGLDIATPPSSSTWNWALIVRDKNAKLFAGIQVPQYPAGENVARFVISANDGTQKAVWTAAVRANGTTYLSVDTPPADADSAVVATTAWVRDRFTISSSAPSGGTDGDVWFQY